MKSFSEVSPAFAGGEASPVTFLEECLEKVYAREPEVQAFTYIKSEGVLDQAEHSARRWRAGTQLSSIDGMPIGIKDTINTYDMPTEHGSPLFAGHWPEWDAASVQALRGSGAILLGKTVTTEFAGPFANKTRNPWNLEHTPGGSSSGSAAAVASGMVPAALGTQVVGSIVRPASYCGTFALKPTVGAIHRGGSHDGLSQSAHGVLGASLEDCWNVLREIALRVGGDPGFLPLHSALHALFPRRPQRVGVLCTAGYAVAESYAKDFLARTAEVLASSGLEIVRSHEDERLRALEQSIADVSSQTLEIIGYESIWPLKSYAEAQPRKLSPLLQERVRKAELMTVPEYGNLLTQRQRVREEYGALQGKYDAFITLSATGTAPRGFASTGDTIFNTPASYLGVPAVNLPLGMHEGLPLGLQMIGFEHQDLELMEIAQHIWTSSSEA